MTVKMRIILSFNPQILNGMKVRKKCKILSHCLKFMPVKVLDQLETVT